MQSLTDAEYWDSVASTKEERENCLYVSSNYHKSSLIMKELLEHDFTDKRILEIGAGCAAIAASLRMLYIGKIKYKGIDISQKFIDVATKYMHLCVLKARSTEIPFDDDSVDFIWMFDVFEHIKPDERQKTGMEIGRVLRKGGKLLMNSPMMATKHDLNFDFGLVKQDMDNLMKDAGVERTKLKIIHYSTKEDPLRSYIYEEFTKA